MAQDKYPFEQNNSPALNAFNVTPHDINELSNVTRAIYVGTGGDINITLRDDSTPVILKNVSSGTLLPLRVKLVKTTSTTAQDIIGLY
ncbi:MAG: hypothetical protein SCALA702_25740 [Melioribacteraceae bacterium]|nr:MAG: hypothetical protein SCALA702_25740 [Melioribacteraceae bacterium]